MRARRRPALLGAPPTRAAPRLRSVARIRRSSVCLQSTARRWPTCRKSRVCPSRLARMRIGCVTGGSGAHTRAVPIMLRSFPSARPTRPSRPLRRSSRRRPPRRRSRRRARALGSRLHRARQRWAWLLTRALSTAGDSALCKPLASRTMSAGLVATPPSRERRPLLRREAARSCGGLHPISHVRVATTTRSLSRSPFMFMLCDDRRATCRRGHARVPPHHAPSRPQRNAGRRWHDRERARGIHENRGAFEHRCADARERCAT